MRTTLAVLILSIIAHMLVDGLKSVAVAVAPGSSLKLGTTSLHPSQKSPKQVQGQSEPTFAHFAAKRCLSTCSSAQNWHISKRQRQCVARHQVIKKKNCAYFLEKGEHARNRCTYKLQLRCVHAKVRNKNKRTSMQNRCWKMTCKKYRKLYQSGANMGARIRPKSKKWWKRHAKNCWTLKQKK